MNDQTEFEPPSPEVMLMFYRRLYPFESIFQWLNHERAPTRLFTHREFAFTLPKDVYLRYNSFNTADELKKQVCQLNPTRFEIGPVYSARPKDKKTLRTGALSPVLRELVFDIDMTDYDSVRTCCSNADICNKCWAFISAAVKILDKAIRSEFGYNQLLWVYSGRRGIHLWISDLEAMKLTDAQRKAVVGWLGVVQIGKDSSRKLNVRNGGRLPPSLQEALKELRVIFPTLILETQNLFATEPGYEELLKVLPDPAIVRNLRSKWEDNPSSPSTVKWADLLKIANSNKNVMNALEDAILLYTYPRLDAEVSKHRNHLLKAPFCVHPKTGRVCIPVNPATVNSFDPQTVPTVSQLLQELDAVGTQDETSEINRADWEKTSLKPHIDFLDEHVQNIMTQVRKEKLRTDDVSW